MAHSWPQQILQFVTFNWKLAFFVFCRNLNSQRVIGWLFKYKAIHEPLIFVFWIDYFRSKPTKRLHLYHIYENRSKGGLFINPHECSRSSEFEIVDFMGKQPFWVITLGQSLPSVYSLFWVTFLWGLFSVFFGKIPCLIINEVYKLEFSPESLLLCLHDSNTISNYIWGVARLKTP
jgi:hypothetical protein